MFLNSVFTRVAAFFSQHIDFSSIQIVKNGVNALGDATGVGNSAAKSMEFVNGGKEKPAVDSDALSLPTGWTRCPYLDNVNRVTQRFAK